MDQQDPEKQDSHKPDSQPTPDKLRIVIAVDLPEKLVREIEDADPRFEVVSNHDLYHPMRHAADWGGDPEHHRTEEQQREYDAMVDSADVLFSLPDVDPKALARTVRANPKLRWVQAMAAGGGAQVKAADLTPPELQRVIFTTSAGVHGATLAEFALFGVLAGAKNLPRLLKDQAEHVWPTNRWEMRQLEEMTVLVVGLGGIGQQVATRLNAMGSTVWGTTRSGKPVDGVDRLVPIEELAEAAAEVDAIVVTLPGTESTHHLVGEKVLGGVRENTILVNVGRGSVVDEKALEKALRDGRIGFAALDVFEHEPLSTDSPLWDDPHVLVSPHTAALSEQEAARITRLFIDNAKRLLDGKDLRNVVDTVEFY